MDIRPSNGLGSHVPVRERIVNRRRAHGHRHAHAHAHAAVQRRDRHGAVDSRARASVRGPRDRQHRRAHTAKLSGLRLARLGRAVRGSTRGGERTRRGRQLEPLRRRFVRQQGRRLRHQGSAGARTPCRPRATGSPRTRRCSGSTRPTASRPRRRSRSSARRTTTRSCSGRWRTASRRPTASRPSRSSARRTHGWNVAYASSSLTGGSTDATGSDELAPAEAWTEAANNVGVDVSVVDIAAQSTKAGATTLAVHGLSQTQHVKKAVFATPHHGARAAYDATVTTNAGGNLQSYQVVVDAETGDAPLPPEPGRLHRRQPDVDGAASTRCRTTT